MLEPDAWNRLQPLRVCEVSRKSKRGSARLMIKALLFAVLFLSFVPSSVKAAGQPTQPQTVAHEDSPWGMRVTLRDGRILILGSFTDSSPGGFANTVVLVDPRTGQRKSLTPPIPAQCGVKPILLNDGKVLIVGGVQCLPFAMLQMGQQTSGALRLAKIFDPASLSFSVTGNLTEARTDPGVILLNNGQVLVLGGALSFSGGSLDSCELYDPATGIFSKTGRTRFARQRPFVQMLSDGKVLIHDGHGPSGVNQDEIYDPTNGTFQLVR